MKNKIDAGRPVPAQTVFLVRHVAFTDSEGHVRRIHRMNDADLTPALAARAIALGAAVEINDPLRRQYKGIYGAKIPSFEHCVVLDGSVAPAKRSLDGDQERYYHERFRETQQRPNWIRDSGKIGGWWDRDR